MTITTGTILVSLAAGGLIGALASLFYFFGRLNSGRWFLLLLQDMTFVVMAVMITFLVAFPISGGRIRLLQVLLEVPGFLLVWLLLSPGAKKLYELYTRMGKKFRKALASVRRVSAKKRKKSTKISKNPKKKLAIHPPGNI